MAPSGYTTTIHAYEPHGELALRSLCGGMTILRAVANREGKVTCAACLRIEAGSQEGKVE